ncbi:MAG: HNH nuclease family protein [Syntrophaceae bacterium]|nr:HNH nuclease family protein [Syntrophaceae bacterium]
MTFSSKWGRVKVQAKPSAPENNPQSAQDAVREIKKNQKPPGGEDYREKSLAIHGLVCARCGREFDQTTRHLLTVHHKDGNHHYNPPDGSNWENLCVYCHEDVHSREVLAEYLGDNVSTKEVSVAYKDVSPGSSGLMAQKLKEALQNKGGKK